MSINNNAAIRFGNQALTDFQNLMVEKFGDSYSLTLEELRLNLENRNADFLIELGKAVNNSKLGQRRVFESMERTVAKINKVNDPYGITDFTNGIAEEMGSFDFSLLGDVAISIGEDAVKTGEEISLWSFDFLKKWSGVIPIIVLGAVVIFYGFKGKVLKKVLG